MLLSLPALAYQTVGESGELTAEGKYKIGVEPQIRLSDGSGVNISGFFDSRLTDSSSGRVHIGLGETDFYTGVSYKWIPIPDFEGQPAIGGKASIIYGRDSSENILSYRLEPLASKKFDTEQGLFTPYVSLPFMITTYKSETKNSMQLALGTEYSHPDEDRYHFGAELGINLKDSFAYVSGFVTMYIDEAPKEKSEPVFLAPKIKTKKRN